MIYGRKHFPFPYSDELLFFNETNLGLLMELGLGRLRLMMWLLRLLLENRLLPPEVDTVCCL